MTTITHIHSSSRFDRTPGSLDRAVDRYDNFADIITGTEVAREAREDALKRIGWGVVVGDKSGWDDCYILFKKSKFILEYQESFDMGGRWAKIAVLINVTTGHKSVWAAVHYPAHVEGDLSRKRRTADTALWTKTIWSLKRRVNVLKRKHDADSAFIAADWNLDFKKAWVRTLIKSIHPFWLNSWKAPYPAGGTHTKRIIDATLYKGKVKLASPAKLLPDDASSDHRPYIDKFTI